MNFCAIVRRRKRQPCRHWFSYAVAAVIVLSPAVTLAQSEKTKPTTATYITKEEVDAVNKYNEARDRNIKVVDIGHKNFAVGIVHRDKTVNGVAVPIPGTAAAKMAAAREAAATAVPAPSRVPCGREMPTVPADAVVGGITHDSQTEAYYIVSGGGLMYTDGFIVNGRHNSGGQELNGPVAAEWHPA